MTDREEVEIPAGAHGLPDSAEHGAVFLVRLEGTTGRKLHLADAEPYPRAGCGVGGSAESLTAAPGYKLCQACAKVYGATVTDLLVDEDEAAFWRANS